jgi:hypothetical protein
MSATNERVWAAYLALNIAELGFAYQSRREPRRYREIYDMAWAMVTEWELATQEMDDAEERVEELIGQFDPRKKAAPEVGKTRGLEEFRDLVLAGEITEPKDCINSNETAWLGTFLTQKQQQAAKKKPIIGYNE